MNSVSKIIDSVCREKTMPRILSVASGHCRECDTSEAVKNKLIGKFLALDSDELTVEYLKTKSDMLGITPIHASVVDLIKGKIDLGSFDLIYSSGLYDYLSTGIAKRLTNKLYNMLDHGGKLVIFNIEPDYKEIGYIESFMNWEMIGRDEQDLLELISEIDGLEIATVKIHSQGKHSSHFNSISIKKL